MTRCLYDNSVRSLRYLDNLFFQIAIDLFPCDYFIEAGAFEAGAFEASASQKIKENLSNCNVFAFEANPYNYEHFKNDLNDIKYENLAISNFQGNISFNIQKVKKGVEVSPIKQDNSITPRTKKGLVYEQVTVSCTSLDLFFENRNLSNIGLWIDVEGHGLECLEGSINVLKNTNVIKIEVEDIQYWKDQKLSSDITEFLKAHSFTPIIRDFQSPKQYNVLFCNNKIIKSEIFKRLNLEYE